jgi:lysophospholipid acyltransferase (LPLAT)-like uncharacterized protein
VLGALRINLTHRMFRNLLRHPAVQTGLARLLGQYLAFTYRTTRWSVVGQAHVATFALSGQPLIAAFWHERLPMMPMLWRSVHRRYPATAGWKLHVLVSRHRDGRFIGEVVSRFNLVMVHGSTSRGGASGLRALRRVLQDGSPVAITPDGPRGPRRQAAPGVAQLAALTGAAVMPTAAATTRHRLLPSWDRMMLPLPFGRGVLVCGEPIMVPREDTAEAVARIEAALNAACDLADAWAAGTAPADLLVEPA